jgi:YesN/AraC family two-component response regulator
MDAAETGNWAERAYDGKLLNQLYYYIETQDKKKIKSLLIDIAVVWERAGVPQAHTLRVLRGILDKALGTDPLLYQNQDKIITAVFEIFQYAPSYGGFMAGVYSILFDKSLPGDVSTDKSISMGELYEQVTAYIRENYGKQLTLQSICAKIGISPTYLCRLFRNCGSTTFSTFLTKCRIDAAAAMIQSNPRTPLKDIAASVGYEDASYFSRVFHKTVGISPTRYAQEANP